MRLDLLRRSGVRARCHSERRSNPEQQPSLGVISCLANLMIHPSGDQVVRPIKIVLAKLPDIVSGLLTRVIEDQADMGEVDIVVLDELSKELDLLQTVHPGGTDVVVIPIRDTAEIPGICSQLFTICPDLLVLALPITGNKGVVFRRTITATPLTVTPAENLLDTLRTIDIE